MMYYNRMLNPELLALFAVGGPLHWLIDFVLGDENMRLDFRRADGARSRGGIQLYMGRTSPLEIRAGAGDTVRLVADNRYETVTPALFGGNIHIMKLGALKATLHQHLLDCRDEAPSSFTGGEAISHTGLMRRYGFFAEPNDQVVAIDSEVRIGFRRDSVYDNGTSHKTAYENELRRKQILPATDALPEKLDAIGLLDSGDVALIEVKDKAGDITRAVQQARVHLHRFHALSNQPGYDIADVLNRMIEQKISIGLIPEMINLRVKPQPRFVPVVAAPQGNADWPQSWLGETEHLINGNDDLKSIRFWRLSDSGVVEETSPI